jgi:thioredoxin-related protein
MSKFVAVRYDADAAVGKGVAKRFGVDAFPAFVILDRNGNTVDEFAGFRPPADIINHLRVAQQRTGG